MIAAWFAQLLDAEAACKLAVYLHGTAGDLAEADEGEVALVAGDLAARLGDAVLELTARRRKRAQRVVNADRASRRGRRVDQTKRDVAAGERFARTLRPGAVLLLYGQLGAGKTAFVRGLARGLGAPAGRVSSPTFTLIQEYRGRRARSITSISIGSSRSKSTDLGLDELIGGRRRRRDRVGRSAGRERPDDAIRGDDRGLEARIRRRFES